MRRRPPRSTRNDPLFPYTTLFRFEVIGLVVASNAAYFKSMAVPDKVTIGVRVSRLGRSSVDYEFALFREDDGQATAQGGYTHVYVSRESNRPVELPADLRSALQPLLLIA